MSDKKRDFHEFALQSSLFKGRSDWYFCFLKSERIAHVLAVLADRAPEDAADDFYSLASRAALLPSTVVDMISDARSLREVLAEIFGLLSGVRLLHTRGLIAGETAAIIIEEYQLLAQKLDASVRLSPFVSAADFATPFTSEESLPPLSALLPEARSLHGTPIKDILNYKGQPIQQGTSAAQKQRQNVILEFIRASKSVSIKDICQLPDPAVRDCSEKTVQRELGELIRLGLIKKIGERRWSQYVPL